MQSGEFVDGELSRVLESSRRILLRDKTGAASTDLWSFCIGAQFVTMKINTKIHAHNVPVRQFLDATLLQVHDGQSVPHDGTAGGIVAAQRALVPPQSRAEWNCTAANASIFLFLMLYV
jgi:hypothetical protein